MRARTLGYGANPAALEYEAEFISIYNPVTDSTTWRRSPLRQRTKWRASFPRGTRVRPGWREHDRQFLSTRYRVQASKSAARAERVGCLLELSESLGLRHSNMTRRRSVLSGAIEESRLARVGRGLIHIQNGEGGNKGRDGSLNYGGGLNY